MLLWAAAFKMQSHEGQAPAEGQRGAPRMEGNSAEVSIGPAAFLMQPWK